MRPYSLSKAEKSPYLLKELNTLTQHHLDSCPDYGVLFKRLHLPKPPYRALADIPYLPVELFKVHDLLSIPKEAVFKTLLSSGTSSTVPSRIYLDRATAHRQTETLAAILTDFIGHERRPMLIVDTEAVISDRSLFSARGAAIIGFLTFGRDPFYLLDSSLQVREKEFAAWQKKHENEPWLIFGFTYLLWNVLRSFPIEKNTQHVVLHGGGWKRMEAEGISNSQLKERLREAYGITRCHNFYGMVEQTGSIYMECEEGLLHASDYSEIIFRDPENWKETQGLDNAPGIIQTLSLLPSSYPGHSLLTADLGYEVGVDQCRCGRKGKTFQVVGRAPQAEPRGCSDVGGA